MLQTLPTAAKPQNGAGGFGPACEAQRRVRQRRSQHQHATGRHSAVLRAVTLDTTEGLEAVLHRFPELSPERYYKLELENLEFFFARDAEERLMLDDHFVHDLKEKKISKVDKPDWAPSTPRRYHELAWVAEFHGDMVNHRAAETRFERIYLVPHQSDESDRPDISQVFCLDWKSKALRQETVHWEAETDDYDRLILRIQRDRVTIQDQNTIPDVEDVCDVAEEAQRQIDNEKRIAARSPQSSSIDKDTGDPEKGEPAAESELLDPTAATREFEQDFASQEDTPETDA